MEFLATTVPGLDKIAMQEVRSLCNGDVSYEYKGMIRIGTGLAEGLKLHYTSKMLHKIHLKLDEGSFSTLDDLYARCMEMPAEQFVDPGQPFAFRANRTGSHDFTSPDVERICGEAVIERIRNKTGKRIPVDLDHPEVIFRTFVRGNHYWTGLDATGNSLHRRFYRIHHHPAALNPIIANAMLCISGWQPGESLIDPMCGSGTIPIEAAHKYFQVNNAPADLLLYNFKFLTEAEKKQFASQQADTSSWFSTDRITGADISSRHIDFARKLANAARVKLPLLEQDATKANLNYSRIISNLPYGIRIGTSNKVERLYADFLDNLFKHEWKSTVLLTARPELIPREIVEWNYHIDYGNLATSMLLIKP